MVFVSTEPQSQNRLPAPPQHSKGQAGKRSPVESTLALLALLLGIVSVVCLLLDAWDVAAWTGLVGAVVAAYAEFIAKTAGGRLLILVGFVLCLVGVAVGAAHGAIF